MTSAMIFKELRETVGIAAVALITLLLIISGEMGSSLIGLFSYSSRPVPFLSSSLQLYFILLAIVFTIAIAFRQTAWELWQGTFLFLLHRPVSREQTMLTKLSIGLAVYLVATAVPLLLLAAWAATPGTHASPFYWSMTYPIWQTWIGMSVVYLGAFASGLLDGGWLGRRLLPLATAGAIATAVINLPWWWFTAFPLLLLSYGLFILVILQIAHDRDYD